jgi:hypothetical protein
MLTFFCKLVASFQIGFGNLNTAASLDFIDGLFWPHSDLSPEERDSGINKIKAGRKCIVFSRTNNNFF